MGKGTADSHSLQQLAIAEWEQAFRGEHLPPEERQRRIARAIKAIDDALAIDPALTDAIVLKTLLLRMRADLAPDERARSPLLQEIEDLLNRARAATFIGGASPD